mgnify:CR=1 FL=1
MKRNIFRFRLLFALAFTLPALAFGQEVKEFVSTTSKEKILKNIKIMQKPVDAGGFSDGHGRTPVLVDRSQVPDTVALMSLYVNDYGTVKEGPYTISSYWITAEGGNEVANQIERQVILPLKAAFAKQGVTLLTPGEYLDTPAKRKYYYETFAPKVSKLAKFLSNIETKHIDTSVGANDYRPFDISVCWDAIRAESLVDDLGKNIGVKGLVTLAINIQTDAKTINMLGARIAMNGPNPIPKEDKKYVAQNMGNGYYFGQIYIDCAFDFPKPALVGKYYNMKKAGKKVTSNGLSSYKVTVTKTAEIGLDVEGTEVILEAMVEKSFDVINESIEKAGSKYSRR